jgi:hypothetical protein
LPKDLVHSETERSWSTPLSRKCYEASELNAELEADLQTTNEEMLG